MHHVVTLMPEKRLLLANIRDAEGVAQLIQKCRDSELMSYEACAAFLRKYTFLLTTQIE